MSTMTASQSLIAVKPHVAREVEARRRLVMCRPDGPIAATIEKADEYRALGDFENAWTHYTMAIRQWLRLQFMAATDRAVNCERLDEYQLADKLRAMLSLDQWTYGMLKMILRRPVPANWLNVDLAAGVVHAMFNIGKD